MTRFLDHQELSERLAQCNDDAGLRALVDCGEGRGMLYVEPSERSGFFYVTHCVSGFGGGGNAHGMKRPVALAYVPLVIDTILPADAKIGKCSSHNIAGLTRNYWLFAPAGSGPRAYGDQTYFIQAGRTGPIKIGGACDVRGRLKSLQTGHWRKLRLLADFSNEGDTAEGVLHARFAEHHIRGEWFRPHRDIFAFISRKENDALCSENTSS